jgi:hypothetical protein
MAAGDQSSLSARPRVGHDAASLAVTRGNAERWTFYFGEAGGEREFELARGRAMCRRQAEPTRS